MQKEIQLCTHLLNGDDKQTPSYVDNPISPELANDYGKFFAARKLGESLETIVGEAALCRCALTSAEDDRVRVECIQQLLNNKSSLVEGTLFALLLDCDEDMQSAALEGLILAKSSHLDLAASIISGNESARINELMSMSLAGEPVDLYHLDVPTEPPHKTRDRSE
jgi:hypothetical protein